MDYPELVITLQTKRFCTIFLIYFDDKGNSFKSDMPSLSTQS